MVMSIAGGIRKHSCQENKNFGFSLKPIENIRVVSSDDDPGPKGVGDLVTIRYGKRMHAYIRNLLTGCKATIRIGDVASQPMTIGINVTAQGGKDCSASV